MLGGEDEEGETSQGCPARGGHASLLLNNSSIRKSKRRLNASPSLPFQGRSHLLGTTPGCPCRACQLLLAAWIFLLSLCPEHTPIHAAPGYFTPSSLLPPPLPLGAARIF